MGLKNHKAKHLHQIKGGKKTDKKLMINQVEDQEELLRKTIQQVEEHEKVINEILSQLKDNQNSSSFSPLSMLEKLDLDMDKMMTIATFIYGIYMDRKKTKTE
jgi:hypothetical protein